MPTNSKIQSHSNQNSLIKFAQCLASLVDPSDVWLQIGQTVLNCFRADLVGFLYQTGNNSWESHYLFLPPGCTEKEIYTLELQQIAAEVLKTGHLNSHYLDLDGLCQVAILPVRDENQNAVIMIIGHKNSVFISNELLDIYLGVAGITSATIRHRKITERTLVEREERLRSIMDNALEIIYTLTPEGTISYASPRWTQLIGHKSEDLLRRSFVSFLNPADRAVFQRFISDIAAGNSSNPRIEFRMEDINGRWRWYSTTLASVKDSQGRLKEFVGIAEDITDRKQSEEELRKAKETAEAATRAKTEFLTNISHEIRTPMTAILGFAEILLASLTSPEDVVAANTIRRNGEYLLRIINDILDLSKIESGRFVAEQMKCSPHELISDVISMMKVRAEAKGLPILVEFSGLIPQTIRTDPIRMRQILVNLIGNAIKFTEEGHICVHVQLLMNDRNDPLLECKIIDTGIGVSRDQVETLFGPFTQGDAATNRKYVGMGLGLALSKRLAGMLGGNITFHSERGKGSTFIFTTSTGSLDGVKMLQMDEEHSQRPMSMPSVISPASRSLPGNILLVEDGFDNQRLLGLILRKAGAKVTIVNNGKEALETVVAEQKSMPSNGTQSSPFDIILMDMQMPEMDGYEATWRLREMGYTAPIIAITAHAMGHDREKCLSAGCDEYLTKPIDREMLFTTIARFMSKHNDAKQKFNV
jgi:ammonium transporter, Amt family